MASSFGVNYQHPDYPESCCAVDWDLWENNLWIRSWRSATGFEWQVERGYNGWLTGPAYEAILAKFGLSAFENELTIDKVQLMSPASLVEYRQEKGLPHLDVFSDTVSIKIARAEDFK